MSGISTHVLDTSRGLAAPRVAVTLERRQPVGAAGAFDWLLLTSTHTDTDGRVKALLPPGTLLERAIYRLRFDTAAYFKARGGESFFPHVEIMFEVSDTSRHHHVPLLLSAFGYSTYRGT